MIKRRTSKNIVGIKIAVGRKALNPPITQDELSGRLALLGVQLDRSAIAKLEQGYRYVLDYELKAIAEVLGVSADSLLEVGK